MKEVKVAKERQQQLILEAAERLIYHFRSAVKMFFTVSQKGKHKLHTH